MLIKLRPTIRVLFLFCAVGGLFCLSAPVAAKRPLYSETLCLQPPYLCVDVVKGDSWESLWPDQAQRDTIKRINRMNIRLRPDMRIAVPKADDKIELMDFAPFAKNRSDLTEKTLIFDPGLLAWGAYAADGKLLRWGPASGGSDWCGDIGRRCHTQTGEFRIYTKRGAQCRSGKFPIPKGGAPMPFCLFFYRGYAFHGSSEVPGYNASHGCVRLFREDAQWLNENFAELPNTQKELLGTRVLILAYPE